MDSFWDYFFRSPPKLVLDQPDTWESPHGGMLAPLRKGTRVTKIAPTQTPYPTPDQPISPGMGIRAATETMRRRPEPLTAPTRVGMMTCLAQTPARWIQSARTAFSQMLEVLDQLREGGPGRPVVRQPGSGGQAVALFGEHDRPVKIWSHRMLTTGGAQKAPFWCC